MTIALVSSDCLPRAPIAGARIGHAARPDVLRVIGLGAGGHAAVVMETLRATDDVEVIGLIAPPSDQLVLGVPVIGHDADLARFLADGSVDAVVIGVGMTRSAGKREELVDRVRSLGGRIISAIHPTAWISDSASLGEGVQILAGAIIQSRAKIGQHVIVNTGAIVEHDVQLGDFSHVASGARLAGNVQVGPGAMIGAGACVKQGVSIGRRAIVGMGAVVLEDVPDHATVVGVPARIVSPPNDEGGDA